MSNHPGGIESWRKDNPWSVPMSENLPPIVAKLFEMMKEEQQGKFIRIAEILAEDNNDIDYVGRVKAFVNSGLWINDLRKKAQQSAGRSFCTLCHLDPWFNNMLFNYRVKGSKMPEKVVLLDFQLSGYTSPGNDLAYFLLTSTTPEFRKEHLVSALWEEQSFIWFNI